MYYQSVYANTVAAEAVEATTTNTSKEIAKMQKQAKVKSAKPADVKPAVQPAAKKATTKVGIATAPYKADKDAFSEEGKRLVRRNRIVETRLIAKFYSESLKQVFFSTNLAYSAKKYDAAIKHAKQDLIGVSKATGKARQPKLVPLFTAPDLKMELTNRGYDVGEDLENAKGKAILEAMNTGYDCLSNVPGSISETLKQKIDKVLADREQPKA